MQCVCWGGHCPTYPAVRAAPEASSNPAPNREAPHGPEYLGALREDGLGSQRALFWSSREDQSPRGHLLWDFQAWLRGGSCKRNCPSLLLWRAMKRAWVWGSPTFPPPGRGGCMCEQGPVCSAARWRHGRSKHAWGAAHSPLTTRVEACLPRDTATAGIGTGAQTMHEARARCVVILIESQLGGWGATLAALWEPGPPVLGRTLSPPRACHS